MLLFPHSLASNNLAGETGYVKKSKVQGSSFEVGAKVTYEGRNMTVSQAPDSDGDVKMIDLSGVLALAVSLPECGLTSLECAAAPKCSPLCQRPLTLLTTSHTPLLAVCEITSSVPREQPLSPRASRATRRCNCWSRPLGARTSSQVFAFLSAPADTHMCPLTVPPPVPRSIGNNRIGDEGASALAAILKETQITNLKCAATRQCSLSCQCPLTLTAHASPLGSVDGHALQIDELKGTKPTEEIDLSSKGLGAASAIIIASCIKENGVLKELKCAAAP